MVSAEFGVPVLLLRRPTGEYDSESARFLSAHATQRKGERKENIMIRIM
jgi:hypothetical protein